MKETKITVVMPVYREKEEQLRMAIRSITGQTYKDWQFIIILDDPQNISLKKIIEEYMEADSRIRLYVNEKNMGCPYSKDRGIRLADTEYVAVMDADDISRPDRLEKQIRKLVDEGLDITASCVRVINEEGEPLYNMDNLPLRHEEIVKKMRINNCMPHPTWLLRREMYIKLGGYTDMQGCEDYDFLIRAIHSGYKLGTSEEILLDYRLSSHSVSRNSLYKQYLMLQYLQDKYYTHKHRYTSYEEIVAQKYTEARAQKYARASLYFENSLAYKTQHKYFQMAGALFMMMVSSRDYCIKVLRYIRQNR